MKLLRQAGIIIGICFLGELLHRLFKLPIPGNVLGMVLLFISLCSGVIKLEMVEDVSNFLLDHLAFFFIPAGVGVIACLNILKGRWLAILGICVITTIVIMITTGHTFQFIKRRGHR
jgi:holin-like protein